MRNYAALITTFLILSGCSGIDKFFDDTVSLPGNNPEAPEGYAENMQRVKGNMAIATTPLLPQSENIWPSRPPALPTLSDVASDDKSFSLSDYSRAAGGDVDSVTHDQINKQSVPVDFPEDGNLNVGEQYQIKNGMTDFINGRLPDSIKDQGAKYIEKGKDAPVIVPNGDGTSTIINSRGVVKIIPDSQLPTSKNESKKGKNKSSKNDGEN
ncbi:MULTISPECIES: hypothetical protein [Commensalibacter]|uniref:hypothetical protein n=1 Tax=Commensalibacter TaxID=1079922 RepID=UPI0012D8858D|nr:MULTISPECIES: hypothetical protein [Commensalibacter]MCT6851921.1 hypothetical protein [Commensalibacter sp.]MBH9969595.1 hypothetical protein [Commensalibacter sp. M0265]MBH9976950.1 hypothetical protein [Commensalibacter sp. M0266]MBH9992113.1 hypothetical protein [Commensalibacter sp. M0270]MBI0046126.1 hypothetical protein [Commensalibacter sp. M0267]